MLPQPMPDGRFSALSQTGKRGGELFSWQWEVSDGSER